MSDQTRPLEYWKRLRPAPMSPLGHFQTSDPIRVKSVDPSTTDMRRPHRHVGLVPEATRLLRRKVNVGHKTRPPTTQPRSVVAGFEYRPRAQQNPGTGYFSTSTT